LTQIFITDNRKVYLKYRFEHWSRAPSPKRFSEEQIWKICLYHPSLPLAPQRTLTKKLFITLHILFRVAPEIHSNYKKRCFLSRWFWGRKNFKISSLTYR